MASRPPSLPDDYMKLSTALAGEMLTSLQVFERVLRHLDPPNFPALRNALALREASLQTGLDAFRAAGGVTGYERFHAELGAAGQSTLEALAEFASSAGDDASGVLAAMSRHCRALERVYPLRRALPPFGRLFAEGSLADDPALLDPPETPGATVGLHRGGDTDSPAGREDFALYIPESWDGRSAVALVVALHGAYGSGRDFVWTWLREARSRGFLVLAPTALGLTWSFESPATDSDRIDSILDYVCGSFPVDPDRILLTGFSDGATFALQAGLAADSRFAAIAPISGVLHPACEMLGQLDHARGRRIRWVHGARDWMFPPPLTAHVGRDNLLAAGADLEYHEIDDLSHAYPREANDATLRWFDPNLALPDAGPC